MAQIEDSRESEGVCEKLFNAIFVSPFRAKSFRISHQTNQPHYSISVTDVPILNVPNMNSPAKTSTLQTTPAHIAQKINNEVVKEDDDSMHGRSEEREDTFSNYISKVKQQMMKTASNVGGAGVDGGRVAAKEDTFNDGVENYIRRAKMKIRTTTTIGNHKSFSFK